MKFNVQTALVVVLLAFNLVLRISYFEYPLIHTSKWGDGFRDYLVAHYIRNYAEISLNGPFNLLSDSGLRNSPLYYYLLALFLIPYDSILTLSLINIFFQIGTIFLIYLITKKIFNQTSALLAALLFSLNPEVLRQTEYIWQPYLMQPFALLSLYLLACAYFNKSYRVLLLSVFTLSLAATLHNSLLPWFPQFLLISLYILRLQKKSFKYYFGVFLVFLSSLTLFYFPVFIFIYMSNGQGRYLDPSSALFLQSFSNYLNNLSYNFGQIFQTFYLNNLLVVFLIILIAVYLYFQKGIKRWVMLLAIFFFLEPILVSSFFNKNQIHYLTASFSLLAIVVSEVFVFLMNNLIKWIPQKWSPKFFLIKAVWILAILSLLKLFSQDFKFVNYQKEHVESLQTIQSVSKAIKEEILKIKKEQNFAQLSFFQIISYAHRQNTFRYPTLDNIILVPLEKDLSLKLSKIDDDSPFSLIQTNNTKFIFVVCFEFEQKTTVSNCTADFLIDYKNYAVLKNIYIEYPLSVYLAQRK